MKKRTNSKNFLYPFLKMISYVNTFFQVIYLILRRRDFVSDKIITINLWGEIVKIPINHRLPLYSYLYKNYSKNLLRISKYISNKYKSYMAIDVGANIGDSAILIRKGSSASIFCIEGDRKFFKILKSNLKNMSNVKIINTFVGEKTGVFRGGLNTTNGTGNIDINKTRTKTAIKSLDNVIRTDGKSKIKLLKIDTDGFDGKVIRGSKEIILGSKPVIFFEFDQRLYEKAGDTTYKVLKYLFHKGYTQFMVYNNFGNLIRGLKVKSFISKPIFNGIFNYKQIDYYDLVAFHKTDDDLYKYSLNSEEKFFKK